MLSTNGSIITNAGIALLADAVSRGVPLQFVTIKIGDGELLAEDDPKTFTAIKSLWQDVGINSVSKSGSTVRVRGVYSNEGLETSQWIREVGVYAQTDQIAETLFCYVNDGDGEELPAEGGGNLVERVRDILAVISNATTETILDPSQVYATMYDLNDKVKAADHTMTVDDNGLSANHNYIFGNNYGGVIEEVTDIIEDKVYFSNNTLQYYRANKTASGSWTGPDSIDFDNITNLELASLIRKSKDIANITRHNDTADLLTMQDNTSNYLDERLDSVTGKMYICINTSGSAAVANPTSNFEEISVWQNAKKLENLCKTTRVLLSGTQTVATSVQYSDVDAEDWNFLEFQRSISNAGIFTEHCVSFAYLREFGNCHFTDTYGSNGGYQEGFNVIYDDSEKTLTFTYVSFGGTFANDTLKNIILIK
ncbi:hypothetical protein [Ilyobacter sp.]|uniref:hypothetical protein n=1 Tax=Ilyobacter sp. TaxID=3100343 RepID=UPI0035612A90